MSHVVLLFAYPIEVEYFDKEHIYKNSTKEVIL